MRKKAFTLVEILLVIIIIGILAAITLPRIIYNAKQAKIAACDANTRAINSQLELWRLNEGDYPTLASLFASDSYFPDGTPECPFGTAFPYEYDPAGTYRIEKHDHTND